MTTRQIDILNMGLMAVSCVAAFVIPFELFLFSYAVLGPLHYLTEISWLHKRNYFTTGKFDFVWLGLLSAAVFLLNFVFTGNHLVPQYLVYLGFASALAMVLFDDFLKKLIVVAIAMVAGFALNNTESFYFLFSIFLPTLIHVFIFTGIFIVYGAMKSRSITGALSILVFVLCAISFFIYHPQINWSNASDYAIKNMKDIGLWMMNGAVIKIFRLGEVTEEIIFRSDAGKAVMRFIAFAYTYHYLNWFSKTSIIKWHEVPKQRLAVVVGLWVISISLYAYDYKTGLIALYFLSMLHVLLEFPLNYRSFIGIGEEVKGWVGGKAVPHKS